MSPCAPPWTCGFAGTRQERQFKVAGNDFGRFRHISEALYNFKCVSFLSNILAFVEAGSIDDMRGILRPRARVVGRGAREPVAAA